MANEAFDKWYKTHKEDFNSQRRKRYQNDPKYKARVLASARKARDDRRKQNPKPPGYNVSLVAAAEELGVTIWTLRNWRKMEYFPEPNKFDHWELWFTEAQVRLLARIQHYLDSNSIKRLSAVQRAELQIIVKQIYAEWG
jgi:hypothetical protein